MAKILVYAEQQNGTLEPTALEILTKVRDLGDTDAVVFGAGASGVTGDLGKHGAKTVHVAEDAAFDDFIAQPAAHALAELQGQQSYDLICFPMTYDARDVAGRLSAKLPATLMSNAMDIESPDVVKTAIFGGEQIVDVTLENSPKLAIFRAKSFPAEPAADGGDPTVEQLSVDIADDLKKSKRVERHEEEASGPKLEEAPVVISGGRGLQEPDNFKLIQELADAIGNAAVGATRAIVDAGWVPYALQVGQTGKTVKPSVYIAVGISGATQHIVGMKGAKKIIAINKDEEAPIFQMADLGIVGDALKIVPQLIEEVKSRKG
ncbi:MAG: electron transfer flavoprotein subunit alpha/FixB family protein [Actinomycetota bacterium]